MGHGDAIRKKEGVVDAVQYTIPIQNAINAVLSGKQTSFTPREKHKRDCKVVIEEGASKEIVRQSIVTDPEYFADNDTNVDYMSQKKLRKKHSKLYHAGQVLCFVITTPNGYKHTMEFKIKTDNNPEFTANILLAYARAAIKMNSEGRVGAIDVLQVPDIYLSQYTDEEARRKLL